MDRLAAQSCQCAGLHLSESACEAIPEKGIYFLRCYHKRTSPISNLYSDLEGNWACAAGTLIMDGKTGKDAFGKAYSLGSAESIQDEAIGHFAQAIKRGNKINIFTDGLGTLRLYYCQTENGWFVSNALSLCAEAASLRNIDSDKFLITVLQTHLPGEDTFYTDVKSLFGYQQICIDLKDRSFRVESIPARKNLSWDMSSIDEALEQYVPEIRRVFKQIAAVGPVGLFGTGGLDSRTVLSALVDRARNSA